MNRFTGQPRALCPCFRARVDYQGRHYIHCGQKYDRYTDGSERESQYRAHCCGEYQTCEYYRRRMKHGKHDAGNEYRGQIDDDLGL